MKHANRFIMAVGATVLGVGVVEAAQDRFSLKSPNGITFAEIKGYETWQDVAVSDVDDGIKVIVGNKEMVDAYRGGIPGNGKPFPDGAKVVKIEWSKKKNPASPYNVMIPDTLMSVSLIEKDSKRFKDTNGWGYAQFVYDAKADTFKPYGTDASFAKTLCHTCHTAVKDQDYIFTAYPKR